MKALALAVCLILAGCATTGPDTTNAPALQRPQTPAAAANQVGRASGKPRGDIPQLEISDFAADGVVCRREAPLGSHIAVRRCHAVDENDDSSDYSMQQEIDLMRQRQMLLDQQRLAREQALREWAVRQQR